MPSKFATEENVFQLLGDPRPPTGAPRIPLGDPSQRRRAIEARAPQTVL